MATRRGLAASFAVEMGHHEEPRISAHLFAANSERDLPGDFHPDRDPMFYRLVANRSALKDGFYDVPSGPGFGLELDADTIRNFRV